MRAKANGVLERAGHTEASVDLMRLSGLEPYAVLCELTNADGSMSIGAEVENFSITSGFPIVTIEEIIAYRKSLLSVF